MEAAESLGHASCQLLPNAQCTVYICCPNAALALSISFHFEGSIATTWTTLANATVHTRDEGPLGLLSYSFGKQNLDVGGSRPHVRWVIR